ncbi:MAG: PCYCGC motif-containing (lipo)protein [Actinomycetota bacterium]
MTDINREAEAARNTSPPPVKSRVSSTLLALGIAVVVIVLAGAAVGVIKLRQSSGELNPEDYDLPAFVYDFATPPGTPDAYAAATKYADDFNQIPCYCGCALNPGHKSLLDCFISARDGNGIVYDNHGAG